MASSLVHIDERGSPPAQYDGGGVDYSVPIRVQLLSIENAPDSLCRRRSCLT